jgi:hypothetical protein
MPGLAVPVATGVVPGCGTEIDTEREVTGAEPEWTGAVEPVFLLGAAVEAPVAVPPVLLPAPLQPARLITTNAAVAALKSTRIVPLLRACPLDTHGPSQHPESLVR